MLINCINAWQYKQGNYGEPKFEPQDNGSKVVLSGQEAIALAKENHLERQYSFFQEELIRQYNGISKAWKKGFKHDSLDELPLPPTLQPETIIYKPGMVLPTPDDYEGKEPPKIEIPSKYKQYRAKLWTELLANGWKKSRRSPSR